MSVEARNLTKRYGAGGAPAVSDVSFVAPGGAVTSLIGPSGAGKSTLLRLISGLESQDEGSIFIGDVDCARVPIQQRGVGLVFQSYALFNHMTVRENVAFGLRVRRRPKAEVRARVDELLQLVQLTDLGGRHPGQLSGGQRQRVAFARALAISPRVLLLDEPFGALDARVRRELREWLQELHEKTHVTTVLVTHDQEEALEISEHVVLLLEGRVAQAGTPADVYDHPASAAVASFLGASLLKGTVRNGRAEAGPVSQTAPSGAAEGDAVDAFVRPHDVTLTRCDGADRAAGSVREGRIERLRIVGPRVKVTLRLPGGEQVTVEVPRAEYEALGAIEGETVLLDVRSARVFVEDYAI